MYKVLLFDIGKVIFDVSFELCYAYWAKASGLPVGVIRDRFRFDEDYEGFEKNAMEPEQFRRNISAKLGISLSDEEFDRGWCSLYMDVFPGMDEFLGELGKTYRLAALTNTNPIHERVWKPMFKDILRHFERVFCSPEMRCRKPEEECYRKVMDELGVKPHEMLFMDDNGDNIKGAGAIGIDCILVTSPGQMMQDVRERIKYN